MDEDNRNRDDGGTDMDLDEQMERDTEIRRDTQVRGSLGIPPSGGSANRSPGESLDEDDAVPEFDRGTDEDRDSER